jgi:SAM-dependent methyltransferase
MLQLARKVIRRLLGRTASDPEEQLRAGIAARYLAGDGIEIGALHRPLPVPRSARVRYVDRMSLADLRRQYPELNALPVVPPDVIDDGETLVSLAEASLDFVIANHFYEHCEDPIGAIKQALRVLKPGGILYLALPDKRYTFDAPRPVTPLAHLWEDHREGPQASRRGHFEEFVLATRAPATAEELRTLTDDLLARDYSIHFHVWTQREMLELLQDLQRQLPFELELMQRNGIEIIFVLRKNPADS